MISVIPYEDRAAYVVIQRLDPFDHIEAELIRGAGASSLGLFADWRAAQSIRSASFVALTGPERGGKPFAIFALGNTGQAGVANAALLARDHLHFRRPLAELALMIRREFPRFAADHGIHRIEARCWADHPHAASLLRNIGFSHECDMPGFGLTGAISFRQFAWLAPRLTPPPDQPACSDDPDSRS